jgi:hypothetical protein
MRGVSRSNDFVNERFLNAENDTHAISASGDNRPKGRMG